MLDVRDLTVRYKSRGNYIDAVRGVSFTIAKGTFAGLVGESGSGKSSIVTAALGLLPESAEVSGKIEFDGTDILSMNEEEKRSLRWRKISLVPQGAFNSFTPVITIGHHIAEVLKLHMNMDAKYAEERTERLLEEVGLPASVKKKVSPELSGGQKQRAAIALALACDPSMLFADEPTTALDVMTQAGILKLLKEMQEAKRLTVLFVTHDLQMAATICDRLLVMKDGFLVEEGSPHEIITNPKHSHTKDLVNAIL